MNKKVANEIKRISETIPQDILSKLVVEVDAYPTVLKMIDEGLADPESSDKFKERLQLIKDSGMLNEKMKVVDKEVEALLDKWWEEEIEKARKEGRLPKAKKTEGSLKELKKKGKQYARRNNKRIQGESLEGDSQADDSEGVL